MGRKELPPDQDIAEQLAAVEIEGYYPGKYGQLILRSPVEMGVTFIDAIPARFTIPPNIILGEE